MQQQLSSASSAAAKMSDTAQLLSLCADIKAVLGSEKEQEQESHFETMMAVEMTRGACFRLDMIMGTVSSLTDVQLIRSDWLFTAVQIAQHVLRLLSAEPQSMSEELNSYTALLILHTSRLNDKEHVTNPERWIVNLPVALEFWRNSFGNSAYLTQTTKYRQALLDAGMEPAHVDSSLLSLDPFSSGLISSCKFGVFFRAFYSDILRGVLAKNHEVWQQDWFAGFISKNESEALLRVRGPAQGQFLVRFSMSRASTFAMAVRRGSVIEHILILVSDAGKVRFDGENVQYDTLVQAVQSRQALHASAQVVTIWRRPYFKGLLNKDETEERLKREPRGSFLFRFVSDLSGALVIAYVSSNLSVKQVKFGYSETLGAFVLDTNVYYQDLDSLIKGESERLKQPSGASPASIQGVAALCKNGSLGKFYAMRTEAVSTVQLPYDLLPAYPLPVSARPGC